MNLWRILVRYGGWRLLLALAAGAAGGAALAALMRLVHRAVTLPSAELNGALIGFVGLIAGYFAGTLLAQLAVSDASERLQAELRLRLLRQSLAAPLRSAEKTGEARLLNLLGADVRQVSDYLCWLPDAAINFAIAAGCFAYMAWLSWEVVLFNVLFLALAAACYILPQRVAQRLGREAAEAGDRHLHELQYAVRAAKPLRLSHPRRGDFVSRHFARTAERLRRLTVLSRGVHLLSERFAEVMVLGNVACLLFVLPRFVDLPAETLTGLLLAAIFARQPLKDSLDVFPRTQRVLVVLGRMEEAGLSPFATPVAEPRPPAASVASLPAGSHATGPGPLFRELVLDGVEFRYENDHDQAGFASGPFSLRLRAGEIVFIVGGNGAGKTTFAKLLCGLYPPAAGRVVLDGEEVSDEAGRARLQACFSAVFSDDPLFDHLLGAAPDALGEGPALLRRLKLEHKVSLEETRFSTIDLSQGQRRRLNLLGALLEARPVLLLDEWAADQDPHFRAFFYDELVPALRAQGRTLVLITHDDRYFDRADRVIKIDQGRVVVSRPTTALA